MSPDDERHGSYAGAVAHWFDRESPCDDCAKAEWRYRKTRKLRHLRGDTPNVPSIGTVRRYQALIALGWTGPQIAKECGVSINSLRSIDYHGSTVVRRETARAVADAYDRLSMTQPEGHYAERARSTARQRRWPPPLAWDDIDDPNETPIDWAYRATDHRADSLAELDEAGASITEVCKRLDVSKGALEKWCGRRDLLDVFNRLNAREDGLRTYTNQYGGGRVA